MCDVVDVSRRFEVSCPTTVPEPRHLTLVVPYYRVGTEFSHSGWCRYNALGISRYTHTLYNIIPWFDVLGLPVETYAHLLVLHTCYVCVWC
jgi:hypothetical protein